MLGLGNSITRGAVLDTDFTAASISGLDIWYDFTTTTASDGTNIDSHANLGEAGSNYNITAHSNSLKRPKVDTSTLNDRSAFFDGNDSFILDNVYTTTGETFTVFWVIKKGSVSESDILIAGTETDPINEIRLATANAITMQFNGEVDSDGDNSAFNLLVNNTNNGTANEPFTTDTNIYVLTKAADNTVKLYSKDNFVGQATAASDGDETTNLRFERFGAESDGGGGLGARIGELGVYDSVISDSDRNSLISSLKTKWGLS